MKRTLIVLLVPLLAACGADTARTFGFTRDAPDEFQVTTRAPLSMPPSLGNLPTPRPGAQRPQELSPRQQAEATIAPAGLLATGAPARPSRGETALLSAASATTAATPGPDIRRRVDEESLRLDQTSGTLVDRLMFWRDAPVPGVPVDAEAEAQRLRANAALGRTPTTGQTPIIERRSTNPVGGLFGRLF